MSIIAIDPGTSNTGLVFMDEHRIIDATTIHYDEAVKQDQYKIMFRAFDIVERIADWIAPRRHDYIVIEGFLNYSRMQGGYTFQTPYLCGCIHTALANEHFIIQTSREVLNSHTRKSAVRRGETKAQAIERAGWENSAILTNDHVRSAALHGIYHYNHKED